MEAPTTTDTQLVQDYYFLHKYPVPRPSLHKRNVVCSVWGLCLIVLAICVVQDYHTLDTWYLPNYEVSLWRVFPYLITLSEHS